MDTPRHYRGMNYALWIDDVKNPRHHYGDHVGLNYPVVWARDPEQAIYYVKHMGLPSRMFLDHDLGQDETGEDVTVMHFLKWLYDNHPEESIEYTVISDNWNGRKSIDSFMGSWKRVRRE